MNDAQALEQINAALDKRFRGDSNDFETLAKIAQITGEYEMTK
jgi:hypothetical protein